MAAQEMNPKEKLEVVALILDLLEKQAPDDYHIDILSLTAKAISDAYSVKQEIM